MAEIIAELGRLQSRLNTLKPEMEVSVSDHDTGMEGYVVIWNTYRGPNSALGRIAKGGTRITTSVTLDEIRMLARIMALKNAAVGLPVGGAKSGLRADPAAPGFEALYRGFVREVRPLLRENGGVFGGFGFDLGARPEHALWACDELGSTASFTGKPVALGGTDYDREGIAGLGVATAAQVALNNMSKEPAKSTFAVQGLGAMGAAVIRYFSESGARLAAVVADPMIGGAYAIQYAGAEALLKSVVARDHQGTREWLRRHDCPRLELQEILFQPVDVLFPCAIQETISRDNVEQIRAHCVVEGANQPCTESARQTLFQNGVTVIPDIIANAGGTIAAFVEMSSEIPPEENARTRANVARAKDLTIKLISENVRWVLDAATKANVAPFQVATWLALKRLFHEPLEEGPSPLISQTFVARA